MRQIRWQLCLFLLLSTGIAAADLPAKESSLVMVDDRVLLLSPKSPSPGQPLRAIAVSDSLIDDTLTLFGPNGRAVAESHQRQGNSPYWWLVELPSPLPGSYRACLSTSKICAAVHVESGTKDARGQSAEWPIARDWNKAIESLYAAWIEHLFDDPLDAEPSWRSLHEVTRQPTRNFLFDHLGRGEDGEHGLVLRPDCADLPYFLRAYFAAKLALPFAYSSCSRGSGGRPPACPEWHSVLESREHIGNAPRSLQEFFRRLTDGVQSGNGRAPATADTGDFYPTRLSAQTLRPGTVYADPYGHTLLLVHRVPQTTTSAGLLYAVDAQPDGTVARKRYWRGNFLFALDAALGSPGFKHFRPVVRQGSGLRALDNREIASSREYGDYSLEQYETGIEGFYDRVDAVLSPQPLDPEMALRSTLDALEEQVRTRVRSVANGEEYASSHGGVIAMPDGAEIFETTGAWEDFATPSRDLRLLIAIDVVRALPAKVAAHLDRYTVPPGRLAEQVGADLETRLKSEAAARRVSYTRSDGSPWTLSLAEVMARATALEMAYNPNDCVELRWGAPPGSAESSTCRRHSPSEQTARMSLYRSWFHERRRPPR